MTEKKRSLVAHYINSTPSATAATWEKFGEGISELVMNYNPNTETQQYIHEDIGTTQIDSYAPTVPIKQIVYPGDDAYDFIDGLRQAGPSIGGNDITELVEARLYESPATDGVTYPATKWTVQVQIDSFGGAGGGKAEIEYTLNIQGAATDGDFNTSTLAFS